MVQRWPVYPDAVPGETLSSWLRRIGNVYGCSVADLLKYNLGFAEVKTRGLDKEAPRELLVMIAARAGLPVENIGRMTFPGTVPFLSQRLSYVKDRVKIKYGEVLFERPNPAPGSLSELTRWFHKEIMSKIHGCRQCLDDDPDGAILLSWGLKVVLSCPIHGLMLEGGRRDTQGINWVKEKPEAAPKLVCQLDRRSMAAVDKGFVQLPGGIVSASQWFKMLQTIFHELNAPLFSVEGNRFKWQLQLWKDADYHPVGPFETFKFDKSCSLLIATAIALMENGELTPTGKEGQLFLGHELTGKQLLKSRAVVL